MATEVVFSHVSAFIIRLRDDDTVGMSLVPSLFPPAEITMVVYTDNDDHS